MFLLAGDLEMSAAEEITVDRFLAHDLFDAIHGSERGGVHTLGSFAAVHGNELVDSQFHPREYHPTVAGTGAPTNRFGFQHGNFRAAFSERAGGGQPGETCANYSDIDHL